MNSFSSIEELKKFKKTEKGKIAVRALRTDEAKKQMVEFLTRKIAKKEMSLEEWKVFQAWAKEFISESWLKEISNQIPGIKELK